MRILAFVIDYLIIGILVYFSLEPFYPAHKRFVSDSFFINHISDIAFILYLFLSIAIFKKTIGMLVCKLKIYTECCIIKVAFLRVFLIPFYILNIIWYPLRKKYIQDEISGSEVNNDFDNWK